MNIEKVIALAKRTGIIFPSFEIYGGVSGFYDYGPIGKKIKEKIIQSWKKFFLDENIFEIETSLIMPQIVLKASGHVDSFVDPLTQCKKCKKFFRADQLIEEKLGVFVEGLSIEDLSKIIKENNLRCPECNGELSEVRLFNLMFKTQIGPLEKDVGYLRPETAQGIFLNFKNVYRAMRAKLPFGVAQIGKSFRNEISPRKWLIRLREFSQMEIEFFFNPKEKKFEKFEEVKDIEIPIYLAKEQEKKSEKIVKIKASEAVKKGIILNEYLAYFLAKEFVWIKSLGIPEEAIRFREIRKEELPHYSKQNFDLEIKFDFGWKEVVGNAYRGDHDLKAHSKFSKKDLTIFENEKILPHVVEPSFGIERLFYAILLYSYREGKDRGWEWLDLPEQLSPYDFAVFPLMKKDGLREKALEIFNFLKQKGFSVYFDDSGSIGKRYARMDEIGVKYCITIDYQTLEDNTVTIRDRNTREQKRIKIEDIEKI
ncbi:MAG: glycine--tRNA ligase [Candidatus Aenigmarchaeota archaeon ex4484_224]|nr:MAG: glycine--tRNA ligase [Candidatus Aenigmarchaeota archaeon ex4484_224]